VSVTYFCPHCDSNQPSFEYWEGKTLKVRCMTCGFPVDGDVADKRPVVSGKSKILCIDDDKLLLGLVRVTLEGAEFDALTAVDGPSGIELARKERPSLILLDVMMPGMDGFEVCRRMRADPILKDTPIIIVTAMVDPKLNVKGFQAGATLAIQKPYDSRKLIATINTALALSAKRPTS
jgi:DNA-binding response OmpR family regulator